ncbi:uncharacterized protein LOC103520722 [Diaphorina citri]|uniref:Uncharacterized protein LOC103520722 n=1 Tax=Diaphorina citri TaxID=121845 RepID=A0A3Q0JGG6_DIACI|nr:uncharacterized protein LOC103520722 [Diaphorina citri]
MFIFFFFLLLPFLLLLLPLLHRSHLAVLAVFSFQVSWVRRRDWHILTSGVLTYTNDARFQVIHTDGSDDWNLQIKFLQKRDNGTYECQQRDFLFSFEQDKQGRFILCRAQSPNQLPLSLFSQSPIPPQYVFWFHNDVMINYEADGRGSVTISTEREAEGHGRTHSRLNIRGARPGDSGNYSCRASNTEPDTIVVFVTKGESGLLRIIINRMNVGIQGVTEFMLQLFFSKAV